jgi:hypothetical protein
VRGADPAGPADVQPQLAQATNTSWAGDRQNNRWQSWVWDLLRGDGRLPPDVSEGTVGRVLRELRVAPGGTMGIDRVCDGCGLPRPCGAHHNTDPFATGCPHCGEAAWAWSNQLGEGRPWQGLAAAELDPDAAPGRRPRRRARGQKAG